MVGSGWQPKLRLAELSALGHMSPCHFAHLFKRSTWCTRRLPGRNVGRARPLITGRRAVMSEPSMGHLLLFVVVIVVGMGVLDRFEARRVRVAHARWARREPPARSSERKAA